MPIPLITLAAATFALCAEGPRITCVVDGDTFWLNGEKVRIADINAPETHEAGCAAEQALGDRATRRLINLLNAGPFELATEGRATDRYGRSLRVVREGLAEPWCGRRSDWCVLLAGTRASR